MDRRQLLKSLAGAALCPLCPTTGLSQAHDWSYSHPGEWGGICRTGVLQSPLDIGATSQAGLEPLSISWDGTGDTIVNNGHTVQVNLKPGGTLTIGDRSYAPLNQFHFHHPSEHLIDGRQFPMEVHFVHNYPTRIAVVGVLMTAGRANATFAQTWRRCRRRRGARSMPLGSILTACCQQAAATTATPAR